MKNVGEKISIIMDPQKRFIIISTIPVIFEYFLFIKFLSFLLPILTEGFHFRQKKSS